MRGTRALENQPGRTVGKPGEEGFSLVEGLIAAALLLVVAVGILPLFMRALESNISGGRSSQITTFVSADIEAVNQLIVDRDEWDLTGSDFLTLDVGTNTGTDFWDIGTLSDGVQPARLGDEEWVDEETDATGPILWSRDMVLRKYSLGDVQILAGTDATADALVTVGHPMLFDSPLDTDLNAHLTEIRVTIQENRAEIPSASGQRITVGHFRTF
ncbi:MAG: hypothetical protein GY719_27405 [bacterium]|nr:hypothetical protein [bacterium]